MATDKESIEIVSEEVVKPKAKPRAKAKPKAKESESRSAVSESL